MWPTSVPQCVASADVVLSGLLLDVAVKGGIVMGLAALAALAMRRASAAARHWVWLLGMIGLLMLPALSAALPGWHVLPRMGTVPAAAAMDSANAPSALVEQIPPAPVAADEPEVAAAVTPAEPVASSAPASSSAPVASPAAQPIPAAHAPAAGSSWPPALPWTAWLALIWLSGSILLLGHVLLGWVSLWRLEQRCARIGDGEWQALLDELCARLGIGRPVRLLRSPQRAMPMTWGLWRMRLLLPEEAATWPAEQRRDVLLHELGHTRRWDCLTQLLARIACALYWFNPLAWFGWHRMQIERERACDDLVLNTGTKASAYAEHLLHIASMMPAAPLGTAAIAMARSSRLEERMLAILDGRRNRRAVSRWGIVIGTVALLAVALPVAMLRGEQTAQRGAALPQAETQQRMRQWVEDFFRHNYRDITDRKTLEWGEPETTAIGNLSIRYKFEAVIWDKDIIIGNQVFTFTPAGEYVSAKNVDGFPVKRGTVAPTTRPAVAEDKIEAALHEWVEKFFRQNYHDITARKSIEWGQPEKLPGGNWQIRYKYEATIWDKDHIVYDKLFAFTPAGEFVSVKDGQTPATQPALRLQVRPVLSDSDKGAFDEMADPENPQRKLRVGREVVLDESAVAGASLAIGGNGRLVVLALKPAARKVLQDANNLGQLAIVLDGKLVATPHGLIDESLTFPAGEDRQAIRSLLAYFNRNAGGADGTMPAALPASPPSQPARPARPRDTSTPRAAVLAFFDAWHEGDEMGALFLMELKDPAALQPVQVNLRAAAAVMKLCDAARAAFGDSAKGGWLGPATTYQELRRSIEQAKEQITGDYATVNGDEELRLHKTPDGWRILPAEKLRKVDVLIPTYTAAINRVADEVRAGKFKTLQEVQIAETRYAREMQQSVGLKDVFVAGGAVGSEPRPVPQPSSRPAATRPTGGAAPTTRPIFGGRVFGMPARALEGPTCSFDGTIYELRVPPDQIGRVDLDALTRAAATPAGLEKALAELGTAKPLYRANQSVRLFGDSINIGTETPIVSNTRIGPNGQAINTYSYVDIGAIINITGRADAAGRFEVDLNVHIAGLGDIAAGAKSPRVRMATLAHKAPVDPGRPFVVVSIDAASPDESGKAVAYVARVILGQPQGGATRPAASK